MLRHVLCDSIDCSTLRPHNTVVACVGHLMARCGHYEHRKSSNVLLLHCIVGPYVFILYMMFHLNAGDDNDDVKLT